MADRGVRARSFGAVASDYDRYRPGPPAAALEWLLPAGCAAALDLAAGTGALTRQLVGRVPRVVAVEPDERMREVLAVNCPEAEILDGRGEDIPLPDGSVDAVLIASAWHWLDPELAVPEIARVLRAGGTLGILWNRRDTTVPWITELNALAYEAREADRPRDGALRRVEFPPGAPFVEVETHTVEWSQPMAVAEIVGMVGTYSGVITLPEQARRDLEHRVASFVDERFGSAEHDPVQVPMSCRCLRSRRI
jgi:SAM-dependent methyltransferase